MKGECDNCGREDELNRRRLCESCEEVADPAPGVTCDYCEKQATSEVGGHPVCDEHEDG